MASTCRLCLTESENVTELSEVREGFPLSVISMIILPVTINLDCSDPLPTQICENCISVLLSAFKLREVSNNSDRFLRTRNEEFATIEIDEAKHDEEGFHQEADITDSVEYITEVIPEEEADEYVVYEPERDNEDSEVEEGIFKVDVHSNIPRKSAVWSYFGHLTSETGIVVGSQENYYFCKICVEERSTLKPKYKIESTATSVLFAHLLKHHGIKKSDLPVNNQANVAHMAGLELMTCTICKKSYNNSSLSLHMELEHQNGALERNRTINSQYKVNCFKQDSKSIAWDYFGILEDLDGNTADEYYFHCRLCVDEKDKLSPKYTKNTSTSILMHHLKTAHISKPDQLKRKLPDPIEYNSSKKSKKNDLTCRYCGEFQETKKSLSKHLRNVHLEEMDRKIFCPISDCGKAFFKKEVMLRHIKNVHEGRKYACDRCPAVLSTPNSLRRHIDSCHLKLKPFACDKCSATYLDQKALKSHIQKVHLGIAEERIPCEHCEIQLPNAWSLRRHMMTHTGEVR